MYSYTYVYFVDVKSQINKWFLNVYIESIPIIPTYYDYFLFFF